MVSLGLLKSIGHFLKEKLSQGWRKSDLSWLKPKLNIHSLVNLTITKIGKENGCEEE